MADLGAFISRWDGRCADYDGAYGAQCVDLVQFWITSNGFRAFIGDAKDAAGQRWPGATWTWNCPQCVPSPGDVVVWGTAVGSAGHVDIFVSGDAGSFEGFDQNWPIGSCSHRQHHTYNGVLGWQALHLSPVPTPIPSPPPPPPPPPAPPPVVPPIAVVPSLAPIAVLVAGAGLAGWAYWRHRRSGVPVTPQTLLQDVREAGRGGQALARRALGDVEREADALRRRVSV